MKFVTDSFIAQSPCEDDDLLNTLTNDAVQPHTHTMPNMNNTELTEDDGQATLQW
jgi:hypothetical protein